MPHPNTSSAFQTYGSVSTDTRKIKKDDLYFGLRGERFDGNAFAAQALEKGASFAIVDDPAVVVEGDDRYILVENSLTELQELATEYRDTFNIIVLALTGSNGKTTTKELIHAVTSISFHAHATVGNLNNHIGVPLTLLAMPRETQIAIIEMGANKPGDIAELAAIAKPTHALITNIGEAHLELFGDLAGVQKTKGELFDYIRKVGGYAFVNENDPLVKELAEGIERQITFGGPHSDYVISTGKLHPDFSELKIYGKRWNGAFDYTSKLIGLHNAENVLAAVAVCQQIEVALFEVQTGIGDYTPKMNRSELITTENYTLLLDAYNANPSSMRATIDTVAGQQPGNPVLILGDMFELGTQSSKLHAELVDYCIEKIPQGRIIGIGEAMTAACAGREGKILSFKDVEDASASIALNVEGASFVLIKGSRGMALEKLLPSLGIQKD